MSVQFFSGSLVNRECDQLLPNKIVFWSTKYSKKKKEIKKWIEVKKKKILQIQEAH